MVGNEKLETEKATETKGFKYGAKGEHELAATSSVGGEDAALVGSR